MTMPEVPQTTPPVLEIAGLEKTFRVKADKADGAARQVKAVSGLSFRLAAGTTLGIVGESGCGKSTTARLIMGLIPPDSGDVLLEGRMVGRSAAELRALRRKVQMVFQDSSASLNPRLPIEQSIMFGPMAHGVASAEARRRAHDLLARVGLDPRRHAGNYPYQLSGGQRQRVNIARALALEPRVVILDEAVSALDKSIELQVLNLLVELKAEFRLSYIFISHDLNVVRYMSDQVLVMYLGKAAEIGPAEAVFAHPAHPYTRALLASMPSPDPDRCTMAAPLSGDPPDPIDPPPGCLFHPRCGFAAPLCSHRTPALSALGSGHAAACHMADPASGHPLACGQAA